MMLGDFNVTEEPIDRAPAHLDDNNAIASLRNLRNCLGLEDAWRHAFPQDRRFTYRATTHGQAIKSRLDRIYVSREVASVIYDWKFIQTAVPTDHWLVSVKYAPTNAPYVGSGRWTMQIPALNNITLMEKISARGMALQSELKNLPNSQATRSARNPQSLWAGFKMDVVKITKDHCAKSRGKLAVKIAAKVKELREIATNPEIDSDNSLRVKEAFIANELAFLKKTQARDRKDESRATVACHGEVLGGVWSAMNKERKPRDMIHRLKSLSSPTNNLFEQDSRRMAKLARDYHESLQAIGITVADEDPDWVRKSDEVLDEIHECQRLSAQDVTKTDWQITYAQVEKALHLTKNGTATGLDGCPYELWKELKKRHDKAELLGETSFDIIGALTILFSDIQKHGLSVGSNFASGWMCPIYKKKDPTDISNYRPITLLNTDYKLLTKTLALQLVEPIHKLVHPDQAGFIPKRSIFNHIRLANTIINYAEVMEVDGVIVALDQEKAYDKIRHKYLWKTLATFNLPDKFIQTIRSLYENAATQVAINRVMSSPFRVTRGVRQGDPLSCLLFDLAIEPLACKLRNCDELEGLLIPGAEEKLIANLFADDTTLYLSKHDRFDTVEQLLESWCEVSGAKFNIDKTEIIPLGKATHRTVVSETRKIHPADRAPLDAKIHIAKDGEAVRSLGAWIGNNIQDLTPWESVIDKIKRKLDLWARSHPTLYGKCLITQAVVGGHTQFLTKAQGMPPHIEDALVKLIRDFVWENNIHPRIALEHLHRPLSEGGLNLLDIKARNEAIELVWLKDHLNLSPSRQLWARVEDILINATAPPGTSSIATINSFLQTWNPPTRGPRLATLNGGIRRMLRVAKKYNTNLAAIRLSPGVCATLPAWYHPGAAPHAITNVNALCILNKHGAKTVADLIKLANKINDRTRRSTHTPSQACVCIECVHDRRGGCKNPHACALEATARLNDIAPKYNPLAFEHHDTLSLTPNRKARNNDARSEGEGVLFDPSITCKDGIQECFRVFTDPNKISLNPARRTLQQGTFLDHEEMTVYTDGSCTNNGKLDAQCGSGVWLEDGHPQNNAIKIPGEEQSNQVSEIAAVIVAVETLPTFCKLTIVTDSMYVINGLTQHLKNWEDNGWIGNKNADFFKRAAYLLKRRSAPTYFEWVKGHQGVRGNEESDKLAKDGAEKNVPDILPLHIPTSFDLQGAKLETLSQALAYRGIRELQTPAPREISNRNIALAREAIKEYTGHYETDKSIWNSIRKRTIRIRVQQFLYKAIHSTQMVGEVWLNIQGYHQRASCAPCGTFENMSHILLSCTTGPATQIWNLAKELWPHDNIRWPVLNIGTIMGCGCLSTKLEIQNQETDTPRILLRGAARLLQISISEAAHLIWVLRCERVIQERSHTPEETEARWYKAINRRLTDDKITATRIKRDPLFTQLVEATWECVLRKISDPPDMWISNREVLVGRSGAVQARANRIH